MLFPLLWSLLVSVAYSKGNADCDAKCMKAILLPWALTAAEEGFRHAMMAYNTTDTCLSLAHCRASVSYYIDEIAYLAATEGVRDSEHYRSTTRKACDSTCMMKTINTTVSHAGAAAMVIGQKNYHGGDDQIILRWFPQPSMVLDSMIAHLGGNDKLVNTTKLRQHSHYCDNDCYDFVNHPSDNSRVSSFKQPDYRRDVHPDYHSDLRDLVVEPVSYTHLTLPTKRIV